MKQTLSNIYKYLSSEIGELEARIILKERANVEWADIIANPDREILTDTILNDLATCKSGKPLSRIYGKREFWGLEFTVNEHTLDPRPDSETLIEAILNRYQSQNKAPETILDLGTGTGCLLLSCLSEFKNAKGIGADINEKTLQTAQGNAKSLGLEGRTRFIQSNWIESIDEKCDLIIANPPYIESNVIPNLTKQVKNHDPMLALDGGEDGLQAYKDILSNLSRVLNDTGFAIFEIGFDQAEKVTRLSENYGFFPGKLYTDLAGNPRAVDMFKSEKMRHQWG